MMWVGNLLQPSLINLSNAEAFLVCLSAQLVKCWIWRARQYLWEIPHEFVFMMHSQSCTALCDPTDCSPPGFSVHGISQARILGCPFLLQGIFPTQGLNPCLLCLLHWQANSLSTVTFGKPWPLPFKILLPHPQPTLGHLFPPCSSGQISQGWLLTTQPVLPSLDEQSKTSCDSEQSHMPVSCPQRALATAFLPVLPSPPLD